MVHDLVQLSRELAIDGGNSPVERVSQIAVERKDAGKRLLDQGLYQILRAIRFCLSGSRHDLVEQTAALDGVGRGAEHWLNRRLGFGHGPIPPPLIRQFPAKATATRS